MDQKQQQLLDELKKTLENLSDFQLNYFNFHRNRYYYLLQLIENFGDGKKGNILDLGANPYHLSRCLKKLGYDISAINYDFGSIEQAAEKTGIVIKTADLSQGKIPVADNIFDYVLFSETLEHFNFHPEKIMSEVYRCLKPGGKIILTTPNLARLNNRIKLFFGKSIHQSLEKTNSIEIHHREFTAAELISLLKQSNFSISAVSYVDFGYPGSNVFIKAINQLLGSMINTLKPNIVIIAEKQ